MYSFFNKLFTVSGNNNTTCSKNRIGNRNFHSKLPINVFFRNNSISLIESEEFRDTLNSVEGTLEVLWFAVNLLFKGNKRKVVHLAPPDYRGSNPAILHFPTTQKLIEAFKNVLLNCQRKYL